MPETVQSTFHVLVTEGPHNKWYSWDSKPGSQAPESEVFCIPLLQEWFSNFTQMKNWSGATCIVSMHACMVGRLPRLLPSIGLSHPTTAGKKPLVYSSRAYPGIFSISNAVFTTVTTTVQNWSWTSPKVTKTRPKKWCCWQMVALLRDTLKTQSVTISS